MADKTITTVEFIRHFGQYHDEAQHGTITLTKHGRESLVVMSAQRYELLMQENPRRVYGAGDTPPDLAAVLIEGIDLELQNLRSAEDD